MIVILGKNELEQRSVKCEPFAQPVGGLAGLHRQFADMSLVDAAGQGRCLSVYVVGEQGEILPADGRIGQFTTGIVELQADRCQRCQPLVSPGGCPAQPTGGLQEVKCRHAPQIGVIPPLNEYPQQGPVVLVEFFLVEDGSYSFVVCRDRCI